MAEQFASFEPDDAAGSASDETDLFSETEDDLPQVEPDEIFDAVVTATDWTTETLLGQVQRNNLQLNPVFQRRDAWDRRKKSRFIESLIVGLPVPQIVLAVKRGTKASFIVLDGKQRLLSIAQFSSGQFRLSGLELRGDLNGKGLESLSEDDRAAFETQTIRTVVVRNWRREEFLYLVFLRLNTGNVPLSPQELRQALRPGPFVAFVNEYTESHLEFAALLGRRTPDFRMRDVELLVRYFAFGQFLPDYNGNLKDLLDNTCDTLNKQWPLHEEAVRAEAEQCRLAIGCISDIFGSDQFRRWNQDHFERPFNRAVFDVLVFYAKHPETRAAMSVNPAEVVSLFKVACGSPHFQDAITTTTKSTDAIFARLRIWGETLDGLTPGIPLPTRTPSGRIAYATV